MLLEVDHVVLSRLIVAFAERLAIARRTFSARST